MLDFLTQEPTTQVISFCVSLAPYSLRHKPKEGHRHHSMQYLEILRDML